MQSPYWTDKVEQFEILNKANTHKICFAGDSFFDRFQLEEFLDKYDVFNRSIGYEFTGSLLNRYQTTVLNSNPDVIYLYIGGNDIANGINEETILINIKALIDKTISNRIKLKIISILPRGINYKPRIQDVSLLNKNIFYLNASIEKLCMVNNVYFLNIYSDFSDEQGFLCKELTNDNIHLNGEGYSQLVKLLIPFLDRA
jgi:lysophospholipase L1-like esterase